MFRVAAIACVATVLALIPTRGSPAADYSGHCLLDGGGYRIELSLQADADETVRGGMNDDGDIYRIVAQPVQDKLVGAIFFEGSEEQFLIIAQLHDNGADLYLRIYAEVDPQGKVVEESGQTFLFLRTGNAAPQAGQSAASQGVAQ